MNLFKTLCVVLVMFSCSSSHIPFEAQSYYKGVSIMRYYNGSAILELLSNKTYRYMVKMEGGYVYEFTKGSWKQEGNKLLLFNEVRNPKELPMDFRITPASNPGSVLIVNVLPRKDPQFTHLPGVSELMKVDLIVDNVVHSLKDEVNVINYQKSFVSAYIKAYPRVNVEKQSEILNDTLRSQVIDIEELNGILTINVDCDPVYFAQVRKSDDTIRIINDYKLKWDKIYFTRSR